MVWFICTRGFWVDNNCLQMAINRNLLKNVLMVIKRKAKHIMPLVTSNYWGGLLCIGFERPDISTQPCQMRELSSTFICYPWNASSKMAFEEASHWLLPEALALALHCNPCRKGTWQSTPFEDVRGRKRNEHLLQSVIYHILCELFLFPVSQPSLTILASKEVLSPRFIIIFLTGENTEV